MQAVAITGLDDIRRIERQPYAAFMPHQGLLQALQAGAAQHGDRPALRYIDGPEADAAHFDWTHAQLLDEVRRAANLFHALAAPRAPRVAVLVPALPQAHIALWGAELAGVACPNNFLLQDEHLAELLRATGANIAVALDTHPQLDIGPRVRALQASCPELRHVLMVDVPGSLPDPAGFDAQHRAVLHERVGREPFGLGFGAGAAHQPLDREQRVANGFGVQAADLVFLLKGIGKKQFAQETFGGPAMAHELGRERVKQRLV